MLFRSIDKSRALLRHSAAASSNAVNSKKSTSTQSSSATNCSAISFVSTFSLLTVDVPMNDCLLLQLHVFSLAENKLTLFPGDSKRHPLNNADGSVVRNTKSYTLTRRVATATTLITIRVIPRHGKLKTVITACWHNSS